MSKDETTSPTPRILIGAGKTDPNPPWTGLYFSCEQCAAKFQLCASDELAELPSMEFEDRKFSAPECWTCGFVNTVRAPRISAK